jgi:alanyl-tRNA synthetase
VTGAEIRRAFLDFFAERGHRVVPSGSLVPEGDPTLMFTNAGMVPFKRVFVGEERREYTRAVSSQKCMRVSGKHNDLEDVGRSPKHQTFFEMLGNFSFGDYFKEGAIDYAWEFLTGVLALEPARLAVTVHTSDDEAHRLWRERIGVPEERIYRLGDKENFWQMGDSGPCGPCSEINVVRGEPCSRSCDPSCDCGHFLEIWNLVFMQFEQLPSGERKPLPKPSIDTGMGLERITSVLQGGETNYDSDLIRPLIDLAGEIAVRGYGDAEQSDVSLRVLADHARACTFLIGEGVLPTNEGRGYVLRRVLRRAVRHGVLLGVEEPFLWRMVADVVEGMGGAYPELVERRPFIEETIRGEEERFGRTLGRGLAMLDEEVARARREKRDRLSGELVFKLYDTYGFPLDLTEDILRGHGLAYDRAAFDEAIHEQRARARAAWKGSGEAAPGELYAELAKRGRSRFVGYDALEARSEIRALLVGGERTEEAREGDRVELVVGTTPFYAESGGQVGDVGTVEAPDGRIEIEDVQRPVEGVIVHRGVVAIGTVRAEDEVTLRVDAEKRAATVRNHSGTHLFHWALRKVLGRQVTQAGSLVAPDRLRFDFTYDRPLSDEQIREVEDLVNELILRNVPASVEQKSYTEALRDGAVAIFEEKYGDEVRVVSFGPSVELCGGTHARATGDVGTFRITGQSAVGAGVRRIDAQTGLGVIEHARREGRALREVADLLKAPPAESPERVRRLLERERELAKEIEKLRAQLRSGGSRDPLAQAREAGGVRFVAVEVEDADPKELRTMVDELKQRIGSGVVLLATRRGGKAALALGVTKDLTARFRAGDLIRTLAEPVGGKGGGRPDFAQAGGPDADRLPESLSRLESLLAG